MLFCDVPGFFTAFYLVMNSSRSKSRRSLLLLIGILGFAHQISAQTIYLTNLADSNGVNFYVGLNGSNTYRSAGQFLTGGTSVSIGAASLGFGAASGTPSGATFSVALYSNSTSSGVNLPGSQLGTFTGNANPSTAGTYDFVLGSSYTLTANTRYWIVTSATGTTGGNYNWQGASASTFGTSDYGWYAVGGASSSNDGTLWGGIATSPRFSISSGSAIPEPSTYAALCGAAGLGFALWRRRGQHRQSVR